MRLKSPDQGNSEKDVTPAKIIGCTIMIEDAQQCNSENGGLEYVDDGMAQSSWPNLVRSAGMSWSKAGKPRRQSTDLAAPHTIC